MRPPSFHYLFPNANRVTPQFPSVQLVLRQPYPLAALFIWCPLLAATSTLDFFFPLIPATTRSYSTIPPRFRRRNFPFPHKCNATTPNYLQAYYLKEIRLAPIRQGRKPRRGSPATKARQMHVGTIRTLSFSYSTR